MGPYLEDKDWKEIQERMDSVIEDTIHCWERTRLGGVSASMVCDGNISTPLLKRLDKLREQIEKAHDGK